MMNLAGVANTMEDLGYVYEEDNEIALYMSKAAGVDEYRKLEKIGYWYNLQFPDLNVYWIKRGEKNILVGTPNPDGTEVRQKEALKKELKGTVPGLITGLEPLNLPLCWAARKVEQLIKKDARWAKPAEYYNGYATVNHLPDTVEYLPDGSTKVKGK